MESKQFTPKEKFHIASTVSILFLIAGILNLIFPAWIAKLYPFAVVILFGYVAVRNQVKINIGLDGIDSKL